VQVFPTHQILEFFGRKLMLGACCATLVLVLGCTDFADPAELETPQIIGIQSVPASVEPGESATLTILVADQNGPVENPNVSWEVVGDTAVPAIGSITTGNGAMATYQAPENVDPLTITQVEARVQHEGRELIGVKAMLIGGPMLTNPEITGIVANGEATDSMVVLPRGSEAELSIQLANEVSDDATYSWYGRPGTIERYRSNPTSIEVPDEASEGWLIAVVRDRGGIAYQALPLKVE
jgi:hypothetical protein